MPSANTLEIEGIALGNMIKLQQKKIEELTLYLLEQAKNNRKLKNRLDILEK